MAPMNCRCNDGMV